jgi:hypothetical protein
MRRVQGPFEHPILFGVFCQGAFALTFFVLGYHRPMVKRWFRTAIVAVTTVLGLSSGPMSAMAIQAALIGWNWIFRSFPGRWKLFWSLLSFIYVFLSIFSRQSPAAHLINLVAFDKGSAWQRILIWEYGSASVIANPVFGVGLTGDWLRPDWQTSSMDMFWLISSVRHGLLAGILLGITFLGTMLTIGLKRGLTDRQSHYRTGYLICMAGLFFAGWTVHFWAEIYVYFVFLMASGLWILDASPVPAALDTQAAATRGARGGIASRAAALVRGNRQPRPARS